MSLGFSLSDCKLVLDAVLYARTLKQAPENFEELVSLYQSFYWQLDSMFELLGSPRFNKGQSRFVRSVFKRCGKTLEELKEFLYDHESLGTDSPKLRQRFTFSFEKIERWNRAIEAHSINLVGVETLYNRTNVKKLERQVAWLVSRDASKKKGESQLSVCTLDSLSTNGRELWTEIRHSLQRVGISAKVYDEYEHEITAELEKIASGYQQTQTINQVTNTNQCTNAEENPATATITARDLLDAAERRDWEKAKQLLRAIPAIDTHIHILEIRLCFSLAVFHRAWPIVETLVERGSDPDGRSIDGQPAICVAASSESLSTIKKLTEKGADLNARDSQKHTALLRSAVLNNWEIVTFLAESGGKVDAVAQNILGPQATVLSYAATYKTWDKFKYLLEKGADSNSLCLSGNPILVSAAAFQQWDIVKLLVKHGANVNAKGLEGKRALAYVFDAFVSKSRQNSEASQSVAKVAAALIKKGAMMGTEELTPLSAGTLGEQAWKKFLSSENTAYDLKMLFRPGPR